METSLDSFPLPKVEDGEDLGEEVVPSEKNESMQWRSSPRVQRDGRGKGVPWEVSRKRDDGDYKEVHEVEK